LQTAEAAQSLVIADCQLPISDLKLAIGNWKLEINKTQRMKG
jgi:hypothetical protein